MIEVGTEVRLSSDLSETINTFGGTLNDDFRKTVGKVGVVEYADNTKIEVSVYSVGRRFSYAPSDVIPMYETVLEVDAELKRLNKRVAELNAMRNELVKFSEQDVKAGRMYRLDSGARVVLIEDARGMFLLGGIYDDIFRLYSDEPRTVEQMVEHLHKHDAERIDSI